MELLSVLLQASETGIGTIGAAAGVAIAVLAAAFGIGKIGQSALEGIARQPEAGSDIRTTMIISAALIEGVALFAIVVCGFIL
ncbi:MULTISPECIES: ATP synthase F0 subunit C [Proteiniphilum]|jgi:F-type H+-transporting ATPase subunit c|uniref:ATP synthase F0 subunit C n=1 Tax=Proteiniphilum TaxID=294702 RepID=UPI001EE9C2D7|nr:MULTISPECIES: ATP synthase F0 subunit C [Proteiniphilum]ULB33571.1 ATP synthase F0 subunit C [Proteiniphilum propionicum]